MSEEQLAPASEAFERPSEWKEVELRGRRTGLSPGYKRPFRLNAEMSLGQCINGSLQRIFEY